MVALPLMMPSFYVFFFFFFNDTATTEIYPFPTRRSSDLQIADMLAAQLDAAAPVRFSLDEREPVEEADGVVSAWIVIDRSEEHTSELQSPCNLVCRLLLEKK